MRMRDLFDPAKAHRDVSLDVVHELLDHAVSEVRLLATATIGSRHGAWPTGRRPRRRRVPRRTHRSPLDALASSTAPLERRSSITAPLYFVKAGHDDDLAHGFAIASRLAHDPEAVVHNAVGIYLEHAGRRDPLALRAVLDQHAATMPRPALRLAIEKLEPDERTRYLRG